MIQRKIENRKHKETKKKETNKGTKKERMKEI